jgi:hypothetical protein
MVCVGGCVSQQELATDSKGGGAGGESTSFVNGGTNGAGATSGNGGGGNLPGLGGSGELALSDAGSLPPPDSANPPVDAAIATPDAPVKIDLPSIPSGNAKVLSVQPLNNATGVPGNAPIVLTFDSAMDRPSVEKAFSLGSRISTDFDLTWNAASTELTAKTKVPLELAEGAIGATVVAKGFEISIADGAKDQAGRVLVTFKSSFRTQRLFKGQVQYTDSSNPVVSGTLSWSCSSCLTYREYLRDVGRGFGGDSEYFNDGKNLCVGPTYIQPAYDSWFEEVLLTFYLANLPSIFELQSASLTLEQLSVSIGPVPGRKIVIDTAKFIDLPMRGGSIYTDPAQGPLSSGVVVYGSNDLPGLIGTLGVKSTSVVEGATSSLAVSKDKIQFRVRLDPETNLKTEESGSICFSKTNPPTLRFAFTTP